MDWFLYDKDLRHRRVQYNEHFDSFKSSPDCLLTEYICKIVKIDLILPSGMYATIKHVIFVSYPTWFHISLRQCLDL